MRAEHLKGLVHVVGKEIARRPEAEHALDRLRRIHDPGEIRDFLASLDLPFSSEVRLEVGAWLGEAWPDRKYTLLNAAETSREERMDPSS